MAATATKYSCTGTSEAKAVIPAVPVTMLANCTSDEFADTQWGASSMTYGNPVYTVGSDKMYIPRAYSIFNWGLSTESAVNYSYWKDVSTTCLK